jgi:catechol 2,3-dioxygenase-like lactoylglutathione lyase family enzyme
VAKGVNYGLVARLAAQLLDWRLTMSSPRDQSRLASLVSYALVGLLLIGMAADHLFRLPGVVPASPLPALPRPDHVTMVVPNVAETVRWYEDKLGFTRIASFMRDNEAAHALLVRDANLLEFILGAGTTGPVRMSRKGLPAITVGRVPLLLDDVDGAISALKEQGVEVIAEPRDAASRPVRVGLIRDLNGRTVELQQPF